MSTLKQHFAVIVRRIFAVLLSILFLLAAMTIRAQSPAPAEAPDQPIPLPQIAGRAEEVEKLLREVERPNADLLKVEGSAQAQVDEIRLRLSNTNDLLADTPTILELQDEQRYWRSLRYQYDARRELLTGQASRLEDQLSRLDREQRAWQATWNLVHQSEGVEAVVGRIQHTLEKIKTGRVVSQRQLNLVLTLQNQVSELEEEISDVLLRVGQVQDRLVGRILEQDSSPLWRLDELRQPAEPMEAEIYRSVDRSYKTAWEFLRTHKLAMFSFVALYVAVLFSVFKLKVYGEQVRDLPPASNALQVLSKPYSLALLLTLIATTVYITSAPIGLAFAIYLLYIVPVVRLSRPLVAPFVLTRFYVLVALCTLMILYMLIQLPALLRRCVFTLIVTSALISLSWLTRSSLLHQLQAEGRRIRILRFGIRLGLVLLTASMVADVTGYLSLAHVLSLMALLGTLWAAALSCVARIIFLVLDMLLHSEQAKSLYSFGIADAERWMQRALTFGACFFWLSGVLHLSTQYDRVMKALFSILKYPIGPEKLRFSLGDVLSVILILLIGYALANAISFLVKNFLLPKLPLHRGVPYAISTISYYFLLLAVLVLAIAQAGVELNKLTVLTGALGVGLGFGLQNIVNNFVSGLILLFERPIHVGDVVDVGGLVGSVRRIGARSSTVVTFQGAEVIVPNNNLLSNQVINWTLSSPWRRVDIPVGVTYGSDPERVLQILLDVANSHPEVLLERKPEAFFIGFGENALNFELRFWSAAQDTWFRLRSDVTIALAKAFKENGIEIPFPQRDLHIRSVDVSLEKYISGNRLRTVSPADGATPGAVHPKSSLSEGQAGNLTIADQS